MQLDAMLLSHFKEDHSSASQMADCHASVQVQRWHEGDVRHVSDQVAQETAVALSYNGISHVVMMASPADLEDFALGFSLSEGIIHSPDELYDIELMRHADGIEIAMIIATQRLTQLKQRRRNLTGRTGCGLCGAETLQQAIRPASKVPGVGQINHRAIQRAADQLADQQYLKQITGAVHGAAWCDWNGTIVLLREDVGRHNALDKLIGALNHSAFNANSCFDANSGFDADSGFVLVTSRASYEMVQKTAAAGISLLAAVSAPTALAIRLAESAGLSLIGLTRSHRHVVYSDASRAVGLNRPALRPILGDIKHHE